jgi:hypothetical protein
MRLSDTSGQWKVTGMDLHGKEEATCQSLFDGTKREIALVYFPGTMAHIKEYYNENIASSKAFVALIQR